jgi:two-component system, NarL family, nitrate/nitrite response regulator NarL
MSNGSVLLIDASRLFREGLRRILSSSSLAAVHEACSVQDALPSIESLQPALVIVNFPDAGESQREAIGQIRAAAPRTRIVVLTETIRVNRLSEALSAGADGYLLKNISADALHQSLQLVLLGEKVFPTDLAHLLTSDRITTRNGTAQGRHVNGLSDREMQILGCLLNGAQNKQIARDLQICEGTVKVHLKTVLKKIGVQNRTQAALWAISQGVKHVGPLHHEGLNLLPARSPRGFAQIAALAQ